MKTKNIKRVITCAVAFVVWLLASALGLPAFAQSTMFTYQGRLTDSASPVNGNYDLTFGLFRVVSGAGQVGATLTNPPTAVSNGLFSVMLDFGNQFPGADRWLEIGVRPTGGGAFATLNPRQPITATPYAIRAASAAIATAAAIVTGSVPASQITGTLADAQVSANVALRGGGNAFTGNQTITGGNVGIGTISPSATLDVAGAIRAGYLAVDPQDGATEGGEILLRGAATFPDWAMDVAGSTLRFHTGGLTKLQIDPATGMTVLGNVGIGTPATPGVGLDVAGGLRARGGTPGAVGINNNGYAFNGNGGDNDSGMFSSADGQVEFYANSVERMRIASTGDVGIGTATPVSALQVVGTVTATGFSGSGVGLTGVNASQLTTGTLPDSRLSANAALRSGGNTFSGSQFVNSGSVGIGTTTPATALHVKTANGDVEISVESGFGPPPFGFPGSRWTLQSSAGEYGSLLARSFQIIDRTLGQRRLSLGYDGSVALGNEVSAGTGPSFGLGDHTAANGEGATAMGYYAQANHDGAFVWADSSSITPFVSTSFNQFLIRATGGVGIGTTSPAAALDVAGAIRADYLQLDPVDGGTEGGEILLKGAATFPDWFLDVSGNSVRIHSEGGVKMQIVPTGMTVNGTVTATAFNPASDRNLKENFAPVSPREVLEKVAALPISRWNFKGDAATPHVGPMAQDFHAAFGLGTDDKHIATVDADGVALAAIQGLNEKVEIGSQKSEIRVQKLEAENAELKQRLEALEQIIRHQKSN